MIYMTFQAEAERRAKLEEVGKHAEGFTANHALLSAWLQLNQEKLNSIPEARLEPVALNRDLKDAQSLQSELQRKNREHETLNNDGEALISTSEQHQDVINEQLQEINQRWRDLHEGTMALV